MKVSIVGCGSISSAHIGAISKISDVRIISVADCIPEKAQAAADRTGAKAFTSLESLLCDEKPDVLVFANEGNEMKAIKHTSDLINAGKKAQFCVLDSLEKAKEYAEKRGIENIEII